jgi:Fe-S-cluster containining protein
MGDLARSRLRTNCAACVNKCCSQPLDWVYVTDREIEALEGASGAPRSEFIEPIRNEINGLTFQTLRLPCRFLDADGKCTVYDARPLVCRLFPFYPDPLVARLMLMPAECGDRLTVIDDESSEGWSAADYGDEIDAWFRTIWSEAARG